MKDSVMALDLNILNITFTTYTTFLTSSKVSHTFHSYMTRLYYAYLVNTSHFHISSIHLSRKGHKSTKQDKTYFTYNI